MRKIVIVDLMKTISLIFCLMLALTTMAIALDYPTKTIQIIVPYPPGGTNDITARILDTKLASLLGQSVIVVNKPGGGGAVGIKFASTAKPDGYTILTSPPGIVMIPILTPGIGFKLEDFIPIGLAVSIPSVITVKADAAWKTLSDLIQDAKRNPGKLTYSTAGPGTTPHFAGELLKIEIGTDIVHVPMGGEAPAVTGILGGHVNLTFVSLGAVSEHLKAGTLRALALMYPMRIKDFPDIPTTKELGYPKLMTTAWHGYFFPAKTPKEIVVKVAKAFETALKDKEVIGRIEKAGMLVEGMILEEANKFFQDEEKKWSEVAKKAKMVEGERK
ncbi:MAG: tripartite tricarboxylate transporter substrate binding protein [Thermodesulfobacteriota bacterium]|nr:tripartite tricarboxylate transporter substrate binding protein [Thermodesulfobacteriota bacterium]